MKNGNPTLTFREVMNLVLQLIEELQIKSKTVMSMELERAKKYFSVTFILIFILRYFFSVFALFFFSI